MIIIDPFIGLVVQLSLKYTQICFLIKKYFFQYCNYKVNHFPKSYEITRKDLMHRNISKM